LIIFVIFSKSKSFSVIAIRKCTKSTVQKYYS